ncbi:dTDP-4-dehydrorhamnose 3,5-epimerase family protein [Mycobacterium vicinigordonae]|uniref:dTDP-4-dehydrorhamnose 3,5-epimerase family protein n=1 Tax=Mycobacterium vicinigordonae TaxID=1719132 RepID=A0A7D6I625_9MYCO|nr:dTDP-4-dehydrorhamnose 3,5-epimerase [Mycobacterium vicinigordonae]QLL07798.1 dTDP-4-dehydrorhamnose 3,5-epimerase family protein [Mycobacterium vicinigordonae]
MRILNTPLADIKVVQLVPHRDARGTFVRQFCAQELQSLLGGRAITQINQSKTYAAGTVRGLHFQRPPHAEMKMVRCTRGRVWDVAVDLRCGSPTFLRWHAEELAEDDNQMLVIPEGFAHGFQALAADSELQYLVTTPYHPPAEGGLRHDDPRLAIPWPLPPRNVSPRDQIHPLLDAEFSGVAV